jgi:hypothetical protein
MTFIVDGSAGLTYPNSTVQASAGVVLQVVNATYSTAVSNSTSTYADTGLTATITPKFSNSKILILINHSANRKDSGNTESGINFKIQKNNADLITFAGILGYTGTASFNYFSASYTYLDSPATTSATTYKTQFANSANAASVTVQQGNTTSTITLMEIAT